MQHHLIPVFERGEPAGHALVDAQDYERVLPYRWNLEDGYPVATCGRMGRFILGLGTGAPGRGVHVDHRNRDRLDHRRSNLRIATHAQNRQNTSAIGGTSAHRGVCWNKRRRRWQAYARGTTIGYFHDELEAALAAARWRAEHMPFSAEPLLAGAER